MFVGPAVTDIGVVSPSRAASTVASPGLAQPALVVCVGECERWPQAQARVNRAMGVGRRIDAGEANLDAGLTFLHSELRKLSKMYPDEAERLRMPASVEAIDSRLHATTVGHGPSPTHS